MHNGRTVRSVSGPKVDLPGSAIQALMTSPQRYEIVFADAL
jgi:hypothetical protein